MRRRSGLPLPCIAAEYGSARHHEQSTRNHTHPPDDRQKLGHRDMWPLTPDDHLVLTGGDVRRNIDMHARTLRRRRYVLFTRGFPDRVMAYDGSSVASSLSSSRASPGVPRRINNTFARAGVVRDPRAVK